MFARFGFMHLVATNLALWIRTVIWESANEWIHHIYRHKVFNAVSFTKSVDRKPKCSLFLRSESRTFWSLTGWLEFRLVEALDQVVPWPWD